MNSLSGRKKLAPIARLVLGLIVAVGCAAFLGIPWPQWQSEPAPVWRELRVHVQNAAGTAAREVVLILELPSLNGSTELARTKTDAQGRARMSVQLPLPSDLRLAVDLPLEHPPQLQKFHVAEALAFAREIEIQLPEAGILRVDFEDERGVAMREPVRVQLHWRADGDQGNSIERLRGWTQTALGGRIQFPSVALGRHWRITAEDLNGHAAFESWEGEGPRDADEITTIALRRSEPWPEFHGRAVNEAGEPLRQAVLLAAEARSEAATLAADGAWTRVECDEHGAFAFALRTSTRPIEQLRLRTLDEPRREAQIQLGSSDAGRAASELGVVHLTPLPLLIGGQVSMNDETVAKAAWVEVLAWDAERDEREAAVLVPAQRCVDEHGRFAFHLRHSARRLLVRAGTHEHVLAQFTGVPSGTNDLHLRLAASTTLRGLVQRDPAIAASALRARLRNDSARSYEVPVEADGSFAFEGVPEGEWWAEVHGTSGRIGAPQSFPRSARSTPLQFDLRNLIRSVSYTWTTRALDTPRAALLRDAYGAAVRVELTPNQAQHWLVHADRGPYTLVIEGAPPIDLEAN